MKTADEVNLAYWLKWPSWDGNDSQRHLYWKLPVVTRSLIESVSDWNEIYKANESVINWSKNYLLTKTRPKLQDWLENLAEIVWTISDSSLVTVLLTDSSFKTSIRSVYHLNDLIKTIHSIVNDTSLSQVYSGFEGDSRFFVSGSAAHPGLRFFENVTIPIYKGGFYGGWG